MTLVEPGRLCSQAATAIHPSGFFISYICDLFSSFMCGRYLGKLESSQIWGVAAHLHDYHRRA
jgi:hypothetical protein